MYFLADLQHIDMEALVISACSGEKKYDDVPLGCREVDSIARETLVREYPEYVAPTVEMYTGTEHALVRDAVANLRNHVDVTWRIISAGYGLVDEADEIAAYDCTFSDVGSVRERAKRFGHDPEALTIAETRQAVAREMNLHGDMVDVLDGGYDIVFLVLSEPYFAAVSGALTDLPEDLAAFAIASDGSAPYVGEAHRIAANGTVREQLDTSWFRLRGELLQSLSEAVDETTLRTISENPDRADRYVPISS